MVESMKNMVALQISKNLKLIQLYFNIQIFREWWKMYLWFFCVYANFVLEYFCNITANVEGRNIIHADISRNILKLENHFDENSSFYVRSSCNITSRLTVSIYYLNLLKPIPYCVGHSKLHELVLNNYRWTFGRNNEIHYTISSFIYHSFKILV